MDSMVFEVAELDGATMICHTNSKMKGRFEVLFLAFLVALKMMRDQRRKQSEPFWSSMVMKKWLNIRPKLNDFSEDEFDTGSEDSDGTNSGDDNNFFEIHGNLKYMISKSSGEKTIPLRSLQRRKSESLRVNYISNKDVSFQEVVPLSAGNVLGAEDSRPIRKWEALIRQTLNSSQQTRTICKSYSAPLSPLLRPVASGDGKSKPEDRVTGSLTQLRDWQTSKSELHCSWFDGTSSLDWPEYPLDTPSKVLVSGTGLRRVMSLGLFSSNFVGNPRGLELQDVDLHAGMRRQYHSSGNLSMLWSEQQEKLDVLNSLDRLSDLASEEDSTFEDTVEGCATLGKRESSVHRANYVRIVSKQMVGIHVSVWVSRKLRRHVNNLEVSPVGVGLLGYMGNKGSISISMSLFQTRLCFVCSHLASGHKSGDQQKRNADVYEILQRTRISFWSSRIFWFGDLNYRIDLPDSEVRYLVGMKKWDDLLKSDQLTKELVSGNTFVGWKEGLINFPPTYKYERNTTRYVGELHNEEEKKRSPAWCDRVLWFGKGTKQLSYWSSGLNLSDHRPVSAVFLVEVEVFNQQKLERVLNFNPGFVSNGDYYMMADP
ncbi:Type I inositol polyphosphate 5-phosphatase 2 [Zea mays]|uniref:Type I inositol polyphosphate 5-phosphatase 2 n=1 Tax=Zea mays TaxID=4577 RepID=A0A3L6E4Z7_MAIZE|nr:Type I inositol polyphosphate 5-phosphatase 2 [Zea mays]